MKSIEGNLIQLAKENKFDVIIHGCNCFNTMGAGIAKQIKEQFPEAYRADCETKWGDKSKLGNYSEAKSGNLIIINAYIQYRYGRKKRNANYKAIRQVFKKIGENFSEKCIGIPKIGAGMAGGDWEKIKTIIIKEVGNLDITVVKLKYG